MIEYVIDGKDILKMLKNKGYNTNRIRKEKLLPEPALQALRENKMMGISSLGKLCDLLEVQPSILIKNVPNAPKK